MTIEQLIALRKRTDAWDQVVLSPADFALLVDALAYSHGRQEGLREAARIASAFSTKPDRGIHPDIPWDEMAEPIQIAAHTTAQQISMAISEAMV